MTIFAGMKPGRDLQIEFIGLKEGEKVSEELWEDWERPVPTETARILVTAEQNPLSRGILEKVKRMEDYVACHDRDGLLKYIHEVVPDFPVNRAITNAQEIAPGKSRATADWSVGAA